MEKYSLVLYKSQATILDIIRLAAGNTKSNLGLEKL